jgi:hypothetical protein
MGLAWDEIMAKSPTMKKLIEDKIAEEIEPVKAENAALKVRVDELEAQIQST